MIGVLCPGLSVSGTVRPLNWKFAPFTLACKIVRADAPAFVKVAGRFCVLPTNTDPKLMLLGLGTSCPDATPVPDKDNAMVASDALLDSEIVPATSLALAGEKAIVNFVLWPAEIVNGSDGAVSKNCEVLA